jgi:DNA-binding transcriptional LysR family regulator
LFHRRSQCFDSKLIDHVAALRAVGEYSQTLEAQRAPFSTPWIKGHGAAHMHLDDIVAFVTVADEASFSAAARKLGTTRVATTRAVANLERALGARLLIRTTRRVSLSSVGRALRDQVGDSIASLSDALQHFSLEGQELKGPLRVGVSSDVAGLFLGSSLANFAEQHPQVQLELAQASDWKTMTGEAVDVVIAFSAASQRLNLKAFKERYVGAVSCGLFGAPDYLKGKPVPKQPADLASHKLVGSPLVSLAQAARPDLSPACDNYSVKCADLLLTRDFVKVGCGLGVLPRPAAEPDVKCGELVPVLATSFELELHLWLLVAKSPYLSPTAWKFCDFLKAALRQRGVVH